MFQVGMEQSSFLNFDVSGDGSFILTLDGWDRYDNLKRGKSTGNTAFMAMAFGEKDLDEMVKSAFRPAVKATGFELIRIDDPHKQKAGLIDDQMRVEIRAARFLICDLTHSNNGAYWEAGYAEGLGKPVIYTCEKTKFDRDRTHFDVNHQRHVIWTSDNPEDAATDLKYCIRATIPEAIQADVDN